jgi:putative tryptophan/tyrosine transport system substrate-binding protein
MPTPVNGARGEAIDIRFHRAYTRARDLLEDATMTHPPIGLIITLALGLLVAPLVADGQPPTKIPRIGVLMTGSPATTEHYVDAFQHGLREHGYVEGQHLTLDYRWTEGTFNQLSDLAAELVRAQVDLLVAWGTTAATAAQHATRLLPIVFVAVSDPVGTGLVASLVRPGGNITGLTNFSIELSGKLLEFLREAVPRMTRVAVLRNPANPIAALQWRETVVAAQALAVQLHLAEVRDSKEFERAFSAMTRERAEALIVLADPMFLSERRRIAELAAQSRLPTAFNVRQYVEAGGLLSYGPSLTDLFRRAAYYVDKILKGTKPADLPVERPTKFELIINLKTAQALGLTIPPTLLFQADEGIR